MIENYEGIENYHQKSENLRRVEYRQIRENEKNLSIQAGQNIN